MVFFFWVKFIDSMWLCAHKSAIQKNISFFKLSNIFFISSFFLFCSTRLQQPIHYITMRGLLLVCHVLKYSTITENLLDPRHELHFCKLHFFLLLYVEMTIYERNVELLTCIFNFPNTVYHSNFF